MNVSFNGSISFKSQQSKPVGICTDGNKSKTITTKELYKLTKDGNFLGYKHNTSSDAMLVELNNLSNRYKAVPNVENKIKLINHEREMMYEELSNPDLTLARNYKLLSKKLFSDKNNLKNIDLILTTLNLSAIRDIEVMDGIFRQNFSEKKLKTLKKVLKTIDSSSNYGLYAKQYAKEGITYLELNDRNYRTPQYNMAPYVESLKKDINQPKIFKYFLFNSNRSNYMQSGIMLVEKALNDNPSAEIKQYALWGGGKYRSEKTFKILKSYALNKKEKDILSREYALHSISLYIKERPDEVIEVLDEVSNDNTVFSPLAQILKDKVSGNYHNQSEREIKYNNLTKEDARLIKNFENNIIFDSNINRHKKNAIQKDIILHKEILKKDILQFDKILVSNDTFTKAVPDMSGKRIFYDTLLNGTFIDTSYGMKAPDIIFINESLIGNKLSQASVAHELGHDLMSVFDKKDTDTINCLFKKAKNKGIISGHYAGLSADEYFACGCQSLSSTYVPHNVLLHEYGKSKYWLMAKDKELYKFILQILRKY